MGRPLDGHHLGLLGLGVGIDLADLGIGQLLDVIEALLGLVFGNLAILLQSLDGIIGVAADIADGHAALFSLGLGHPCGYNGWKWKGSQKRYSL